MASVSLILPLAGGALPTADAVEKYREGLTDRGHAVEVIGVADPRTPGLPLVPGPWWRSFVTDEPGLASSAAAGLRSAKGDILVVLDPNRNYALDDLARVVEPIERHEADESGHRRCRRRRHPS